MTSRKAAAEFRVVERAEAHFIETIPQGPFIRAEGGIVSRRHAVLQAGPGSRGRSRPGLAEFRQFLPRQETVLVAVESIEQGGAGEFALAELAVAVPVQRLESLQRRG